VVIPFTPVRAPFVATLSPLEVSEKVPVAFPIVAVEPVVEAKVTFPLCNKLLLSVVAPVTLSVLLSVVAPVTPRVPPTVAFPEEASVVKDPLAALDPPIDVPLIVPPVIVAPDEAKVLAVVAPFKETVPVLVENVPVPVCAKFPEEARFVNFPVDAVEAPIGVPSIEPPIMVAPDEAKVFAVVEPFRLVVPVTASEPPKLVAPVPTVNVFDPPTVVLPFKEIAPLPVEKVVAPVCARFAARSKLFPVVSRVTSGVPMALVNSNALVVFTLGVKIAPGPVPLKVNVLTPCALVTLAHLSETS
jgi:hypothetical protein